jgi:hypothetical protein
MTEPVRQKAFDPRQPFSRAEARAAGISLDTLLGPRFQKICWDTYLARDVPITPQIRSRAALRLAPPGTHISHETAAQLGCRGPAGSDDPHHHPDRKRPTGAPRHQVALLRVAAAADDLAQGPARLDAGTDLPGPRLVGHGSGRSGGGRRWPAQAQAHLYGCPDGCRRCLVRTRSSSCPAGGPAGPQRRRLRHGDATTVADRPGWPAGAAGEPDHPPRARRGKRRYAWPTRVSV